MTLKNVGVPVGVRLYIVRQFGNSRQTFLFQQVGRFGQTDNDVDVHR